MARTFIAETGYRTVIAFVPEQVENLLTGLMTEDDRLLLVSDESGSLTGMIGFVVYDHPISGERVGAEAFWWSERPGAGIKLLKAAEQWARSKGALVLQMIQPVEADRVGKIYERFGYRPVELLWQRRT